MPHTDTRPPLVDIHCHMLPELDDGARSWDESLAMARLAVEDGASTILCTSHQLGGYARNRGDAIRRQTELLQQRLDAERIPLRVMPGADVRIEPDMLRAIQSGDVLTLGDRRRHILLELPHEVFFPLDRLLVDLDRAGIVGILSHPERNVGILAQPRVLDGLVDAGCLLQVTAGSLLGAFGPQIEQFAQSLVQQGLVHFVASDAHGAKTRRPLLGRSWNCIAELAGEDAAAELCARNPAAVAAGQRVTPGRREVRRPPARGGWFRWKKAG